jgi:hypothetical protein
VIPETVMGLPFHVLINHAAVVLVPLAALSVIAIAVVPRWRERYGVLVAGAAVIASITVFVTVLSGQAFEENLLESSQLGGDSLDKVGEHAGFAETLRWYVLALAIFAVALVVLVRQNAARNVIMIVAAVAVLAAGASIVQVVLTGHSGSTAVWNPSG